MSDSEAPEQVPPSIEALNEKLENINYHLSLAKSDVASLLDQRTKLDDEVESIEARTNDKHAMVKRYEADRAEVERAKALIQRNSTVDKTFLTEVWSDPDDYNDAR